MPSRVSTAAMQARETTSEGDSSQLIQLPELPAAVLACILQHVPQQQRLTSCALVCRAWAAAAAAVPKFLDRDLSSDDRCMQLRGWLAKHGGAVETLTAKGDESGSQQPDRGFWQYWLPLQLPVAKLMQLRSLDLVMLKLELPAQGITSRSITSTSRGSSLSGDSSSGSNSSSSNGGVAAGAAAVLPQLQALKLSTGSATATATADGIMLPQLQELKLTGCQLTLQLLQQLLSAPALTKLQWQCVEVHSDTWSRLPRSQVLATLWQQLQLLPKLAELRMGEGTLTAADIRPLSALQRLQHLSLGVEVYVNLAGRLAPASLRAVQDATTMELLSALQHLTQLRHLELHDCALSSIEVPLTQQDDRYRCFSALTASTQLTALVIRNSYEVPFPLGAWDYIMPVGRVLPNLYELRLEFSEGWDVATIRTQDDMIRLVSPHCMKLDAVLRMARNCPALKRVKLLRVVEGWASWLRADDVLHCYPWFTVNPPNNMAPGGPLQFVD